MNYNDSPILSNDEYLILNSKYNQEKPIEKIETIKEICSSLSRLINSNITTQNKLNHNVLNTLTKCDEILDKINNNLLSTFNLPTKPNLNHFNLDIFSYIACLIKLLELFSSWIKIETKEYYKHIAIKNNDEILFNLKNIIQAIKENNPLFFKHI